MPVYVYHNGHIVDKSWLRPPERARSELPAPQIQSFSSYPSPIDGASISSHRQREKDLYASGSYDPRDTPVEFKKAQDVRRQRQRAAPEP